MRSLVILFQTEAVSLWYAATKKFMLPFRGKLLRSHRIIEWPGLKRTTMITQFLPPATCRVANQQTRLPRATSSLALNACRDGASTASLGNLGTVRHHPLGEKLSPNIHTTPFLSQFKTIPPCPTTVHPCKQPFSLLFIHSL